MKIVTVLGARPQFIKAAVLSRAIDIYNNNNNNNNKIFEVIIHTGQHYDHNMSQVFFDELDLPTPDYNLAIGGGLHGASTGQMLERIESVLLDEKPDWVLVYGDTNSTLAAALAASKLHIPIAHVESGLRSYNRKMPEEINRVLTDQLSALLFCPTNISVSNLKMEGVVNGVHNIGDIMYDASLFYRNKAHSSSSILKKLNLTTKKYVLATCHRAENTDSKERLSEILEGLSEVAKLTTVLLPMHPRTKGKVKQFGFESLLERINVVEPLPFLDMVLLEENASKIITDSGGVQKESYFFKVPCITLRDETEWVETIDAGWNVLVGANSAKIVEVYNHKGEDNYIENLFGDGNTASRIIDALLSF